MRIRQYHICITVFLIIFSILAVGLATTEAVVVKDTCRFADSTAPADDHIALDLQSGCYNANGMPCQYNSRGYRYLYTGGKEFTFHIEEPLDAVVFGNEHGVGFPFVQAATRRNEDNSITVLPGYEYVYISARLRDDLNADIPLHFLKDGISFIRKNLDLPYGKTDRTPYVIKVTDPPEDLKEYRLAADGKTDCSQKLFSLFQSDIFHQLQREHDITLIFDGGNAEGSYLFKSPVVLSGLPLNNTNLKVLFETGVEFSLASVKAPSLDELNGDMNIPAFNCFSFFEFDNLEIEGGETTVIDGGLESLLKYNNYYEGIETPTGKCYNSSFQHAGIVIGDCKNVCIRNLQIDNCVTGALTISRAEDIAVSNVNVHNVIGDNGITLANSPGGYIHVAGCNVYDCRDVGICIQGDSALVEKCSAIRCGNYASPESDDYGVNGSFNCGGAFGTEPRLNGYSNSSIVFSGCTAKDCYNYAWYADTPGLRVENSRVDNLVNVWKPEWERYIGKGFRYSSLGHHKKAVAVVTYTAASTSHAMVFYNCSFDGVSYLTYSNRQRNAVLFSNCRFNNFERLDYPIDERCETLDCQFDESFTLKKF